jgi:glycosyltransferase involved in cell wall biosynthesis
VRVLLVSDSYPPLIGGATRATQQLGRQLTARGHHVVVATAWQRDTPAVEDDAGVVVHRLRGLVSRFPGLSADEVRYTPPPFPDPELVWRLRRLIRAERPEIIHSYGWLSYSAVVANIGTSIAFLLAARDYGNICALRTLVRSGRHGGEICDGPAWPRCLPCAGAFYGQPKGLAAVSGVLGSRRALRRAIDGLHSTSRFTQDVVHRHLLRPDSAVPDAIVPDFREDDHFGPPDQAILAQLPAEPFILFVGAFRRVKGRDLLISAYQRLDDPPPLVMIGGRGPEPLPAFPPGVLPLFDVPHDTVMAAWRRALFGVFPSIVPETLGNVVHEAMSQGRAVIGTCPGGHLDMIEDGVNGIVVPSGDEEALTDALRRLIESPDLCRRLGQAGVARATAFSSEVVVPRMEALYGDVILHRSSAVRRPGDSSA